MLTGLFFTPAGEASKNRELYFMLSIIKKYTSNVSLKNRALLVKKIIT
jgi:hypothetical protein